MTAPIRLVPKKPSGAIIWAGVKGTCSPLGGMLGIVGY